LQVLTDIAGLFGGGGPPSAASSNRSSRSEAKPQQSKNLKKARRPSIQYRVMNDPLELVEDPLDFGDEEIVGHVSMPKRDMRHNSVLLRGILSEIEEAKRSGRAASTSNIASASLRTRLAASSKAKVGPLTGGGGVSDHQQRGVDGNGGKGEGLNSSVKDRPTSKDWMSGIFPNKTPGKALGRGMGQTPRDGSSSTPRDALWAVERVPPNAKGTEETPRDRLHVCPFDPWVPSPVHVHLPYFSSPIHLLMHCRRREFMFASLSLSLSLSLSFSLSPLPFCLTHSFTNPMCLKGGNETSGKQLGGPGGAFLLRVAEEERERRAGAEKERDDALKRLREIEGRNSGSYADTEGRPISGSEFLASIFGGPQRSPEPEQVRDMISF
jgi:hypothetical protein